MKTPEFSTLNIKFDGGIGLLELNMPPSNIMTMDFFTEFATVVEFIRSEREFRALVISGHGRHFSSGADLGTLLKEVLEHAETDKKDGLTKVPDFLSNNYKSLLMLESLSIPVIAAIRGVCLGSALELALFSHFRLSGEDAVFGLPEASFNLVPGLGGIYKLVCISGEAVALDHVLKGSTFTAPDALRYKIVDRVVPKKQLMSAAFSFARELMEDYNVGKRALYIKKYLS